MKPSTKTSGDDEARSAEAAEHPEQELAAREREALDEHGRPRAPDPPQADAFISEMLDRRWLALSSPLRLRRLARALRLQRGQWPEKDSLDGHEARVRRARSISAGLYGLAGYALLMGLWFVGEREVGYCRQQGRLGILSGDERLAAAHEIHHRSWSCGGDVLRIVREDREAPPSVVASPYTTSRSELKRRRDAWYRDEARQAMERGDAADALDFSARIGGREQRHEAFEELALWHARAGSRAAVSSLVRRSDVDRRRMADRLVAQRYYQIVLDAVADFLAQSDRRAVLIEVAKGYVALGRPGLARRIVETRLGGDRRAFREVGLAPAPVTISTHGEEVGGRLLDRTDEAAYTFRAAAGQHVEIAVISDDFRPRLEIEAPSGERRSADPAFYARDSRRGFAWRMLVPLVADEDGAYRLFVGSEGSGGRYRISVEVSGPAEGAARGLDSGAAALPGPRTVPSHSRAAQEPPRAQQPPSMPGRQPAPRPQSAPASPPAPSPRPTAPAESAPSPSAMRSLGAGSVSGQVAGSQFTVSVSGGRLTAPREGQVRVEFVVRQQSVDFYGPWAFWRDVVGGATLAASPERRFTLALEESRGWTNGPATAGASRGGTIVFYGTGGLSSLQSLTLSLPLRPGDRGSRVQIPVTVR